LLCAAGCASTGKTPEDRRYTLYKDVSYGVHERNLMDISLPDAADSDGVILFIHGGIWMFGDKSNCPVFLDTFRNEFAVASISHRYIDDTTHVDDLMNDVSAAVAFIRDFCAQNNRDAKKLIIMGHSSGAHLSLLYAYKKYETSPIPIRFCVSMAGPADLSDIAYLYNFKKLGWLKLFYEVGEKLTGYHPVEGDITDEGYSEVGRKTLAAVSPITFVSNGVPPTIIVHDAADTLVPYANSAALNSVFNVYGLDHYFIASYSGIGHFLGAKTIKGGALLYDKVLEARIIKTMREYIEKYCT
jgi:acetyl esterase/lipase